MQEKIRIEVLERRDFLLGASAVGALAGILGLAGGATAQQPAGAPAQQVTWQDAMKALIGEAKPADGKITLDLPEIAENGNVVPFSILVDSPMTEQDYVKVVHIFATGNPRPDVASVYFTPQNGKAVANSRMRLSRTQDIVAVAEMSDGKLFMGKRTVKVTIGGCGG
jgi:sulfur-oxidizing protein SoxY